MCVEIRISCDVWARYNWVCRYEKSNNEQMQFRRLFHSRVVVWHGTRYLAWFQMWVRTICFALFLFRRFLLLPLLLFVYFTFNVYSNSVLVTWTLWAAHAHNKHWSVRLFVYYKFILMNMNTQHCIDDLANVHCLLFAIINHKQTCECASDARAAAFYVLFIRFTFY